MFLRAAATSTPGSASAADDAGGDADVVDVGSRAGDAPRELRRSGPALVARPAQRRARPSIASAWRSRRSRRDAAAQSPQRATRYLRKLRRLDRGIATCMTAVPRGAAQARHRSRRLRVLRRPLRHRSRRSRDPGPHHRGAALGRRAGRARRDDRARARAGRVPRDVGQLEGGRDSRARDRRDRDVTSCTATRSGPRAPAATLTSKMEAANADAMVKGFTGGRRGCRT